MHHFIVALEWLAFVGGVTACYCVYRRWRAKQYRRAKREALAAAEWAVRANEAELERKAAHEARRATANLDISNRKN